MAFDTSCAQSEIESVISELCDEGRLNDAALAERWATALKDSQTGGNAYLRARMQQAGYDSLAIDAALATLERAHAMAPNSVDATYALALALQNRGQAKEALPLFAEVAEKRPKDAGALTNYALDLVQTGEAQEAVPPGRLPRGEWRRASP